jgi:hypothetical protein
MQSRGELNSLFDIYKSSGRTGGRAVPERSPATAHANTVSVDPFTLRSYLPGNPEVDSVGRRQGRSSRCRSSCHYRLFPLFLACHRAASGSRTPRAARLNLPLESMAVVAIASHKGGVSKTTLAIRLWLFGRGHRLQLVVKLLRAGR